MADLTDNLTILKGIGEKKALTFHKLGVFSLFELISYFPRRYEDRSRFTTIALAVDDDAACVRAVIADEPRLVRIKKGLELVKFKIADETGIADVTFFNQAYMKNNLHRGEEYVFFGRFEISGRHKSLINPLVEKSVLLGETTGRIVPVYRLTSGINQKTIIQSINSALQLLEFQIPEVIPESVRNRLDLKDSSFAYRNIHFPSDFSALEKARKKLAFEELFILAAALFQAKNTRKISSGISIHECDMNVFYSTLPFSPTKAQMKAIDDAFKDMTSGNVMNRLVQGDVGSGKTLVAAALCYAVCCSGYTCAFMAPTEILAEQHLKTFRSFLSPFHFTVEKLTGSMTVKEKKDMKQRLKNGEINVIIGTHALFSADTEYSRLALVITDEQHRFGVEQRSALFEKGMTPHMLVMSATPIPRTLALIIYGELDVSIINELPAGRQSVETFSVDESYRSRLNSFIRKQHLYGNQTFVVCPMVDENEKNTLSLKSAEEHAVYLQQQLPDLKVSCIHGKMKQKDRDEIMSLFSAGKIDVLVSTTVIEVGVDVPNATLMIVENAERFGLSQLHQLRGRVGRGESKSYCVLVSSGHDDNVKSRLDIMCKTSDGFKISEEDLRLRGPGDFFGSRQHGLPEMHLADLGADVNLMKLAQSEAAIVLEDDPTLSKFQNRELKKRIDSMFSDNFNRFN